MLRLIYSLHLVLYGLVVFVVGFLLVPLGYLSLLIIQVKALTHHLYTQSEGGLQSSSRALLSKPKISQILRVFGFLFVGPIYLIVKNFSDTKAFIENCLSEKAQTLPSNTKRKDLPIKREDL